MGKLTKILTGVILVFVTIIVSVGCNKELPPAPKEKVKINFILETSGSMAGFLTGPTSFKQTIPSLIASIDNYLGDSLSLPYTIQNFYPFLVPDDQSEFTEFQGTLSAFQDSISANKLMRSTSSRIDLILERAIAKMDTSSVTMFVSDLALSYSANDISENKNINFDNIGTLGGKIQSVMGKAKSAGFSVLLLQFISEFNGKYYAYDNSFQEGNFNLPYYVVVIGKKELLLSLNTTLSQKGIKANNIAFFGGETPVESRFVADETQAGAFFNYDEHDKECKFRYFNDPSYKMDLYIDTKESYPYVKVEELEEKISIQAMDGLNSESFELKEVNYKTTDNKSFNAKLSIKINKFEGEKRLRVTVNTFVPQWVLLSQTDNDLVGSPNYKTFGLKQFYKGLYYAYYGDKSTIFDETFKLNK